jgi:nucleoside-diphosphate-sugar epimerase
MDELARLANKRLVILGCGYLGAAVAAQARAAGLHVEALTRNPARAAEMAALGVATVVDDLATDTWHRRIAPGAELVLDCVGAGGGGVEGYRHSYVDGLRSVLAWARQGPVGTLVYTSSTSVYPQTGGAVVDETAAADTRGPTSRILREAEGVLRQAGEACGRWFILRLAGIYGPGRHHLLDQVRTGAEALPGDGGHRLNLAHRDDICAAVFAAFAAPPRWWNRVYNVADDAPGAKAEVVGWLAQQLGRAPPRFTGGPASARRGFAVPPDRIISNARLRAELGWRPRYPSFREGYAAIMTPGTASGGAGNYLS